MRSSIVVCLFILVICFACSSAMADVVSVEVTITAVDPQARGITVAYDTKDGKKTIELDVSRKADISVNGKTTDLDSLRPGQKANVAYENSLEVVTKIAAVGSGDSDGPKQPELVEVSELNPGMSPWLSDDGLTIYWERKGTIWNARRESPESYFTDKKELFPGRHPTLLSDGLEMIFLATGPENDKGELLYAATRDTIQQPFKRAAVIRELSNQRLLKNPCLSPDGLTLYFNRSPSEGHSEIAVSARSTRTSAWSRPKPLQIQSSDITGRLTWPFVTGDELRLFCSNEGGGPQGQAGHPQELRGNLWIWSRTSTEQPFAKGSCLAPEGLPPLLGRSPRYVAATNELFFTKVLSKSTQQIWVVKNFHPPMKAD